ncbi:MAG: fluoride efflux transporter CrcB [Bacteroidota bacterium]|jgi:CrcB protein
MEIKSLIYVGLGGGIGSICRYIIYILLPFQIGKSFPWPTLVVNILGSLFIGIIYALFQKNQLTSPQYILIVTGVLGGFTTFSAFSIESFQLLKNGELFLSMVYVLTTITIAILSVWVGIKIIK